MNIRKSVPIIFVGTAQNIASRRVGGYSTAKIETRPVAYDPEQLAVVAPAYPVAGHGRILARGLAQHASQRVEAGFRDRGLPGALATAFGKLIKNAPGFLECVLPALGNQQYIHADGFSSEIVGHALDRIDHAVKRFDLREPFDARLAKFLFFVAARGGYERLRQNDAILDQIGYVEDQSAAARLAVENGQPVWQAKHPARRGGQTVGEIVAVIEKTVCRVGAAATFGAGEGAVVSRGGWPV